MHTQAEEMPKKVTPPTVAGTPEANQTALLGKVADFLGPEAMKDNVQKLEFGRDFLAAVPQQDRPVAARLLHRLNLETLPKGEHENWAKIPVEQQRHMFALMSRFIDNRVATEGMRHADKPVFRREMKYHELINFFQKDVAEGLQNRLAAGQTLTVDDTDIEAGGPLDLWLKKNGFTQIPVVGTGHSTIESTGKTKSSYQQLQERYQRVLATRKKPTGRPLRQEYEAHENSDEYRQETETLPAHPAEDEEIQKALREIARFFPSDKTGELNSAARNKYQRQLRLWTRRMINANRQNDMRLMGQKTELEMKLTHLDPNTGKYNATERALKLVNDEIEKTKADRPIFDPIDGKEHKHPEISTILFDIDRDYKDWLRRFKEKFGEIVSLDGPRGKTIGERPATPEDEEQVHNYLDVDHEAEAAEFAKQLRTAREKAYLYHIANKLNFIYDRPEFEAPKCLPKLPNHRSEKLFTRVTDEYVRFLEKRFFDT